MDQELRDGYCGYVACNCTLNLYISGLNLGPDGSNNVGVNAISNSSCGEGGITQSVTVSSNQSWLTVSMGGDGKTLYYTAQANTSTSSRSATITFKNSCGATKTVSVTQAFKQEYKFLIGDSYGNITNTSESVSLIQTGNPGGNAFLIESTLNDSFVEASVSSNTGSSWLEITLQRASSSNYYILTYEASSNTTYSTRSAVVTVKQSGSNKTVTLNVSQAGLVATCTIQGTVTVYSSYVDLSLNVNPSNTCGSSFKSASMILTITGGKFQSGSGFTLDSSRENATINDITIQTKRLMIYYTLDSGYTCQNVHISGTVNRSGNEGQCGSCGIGYSIVKRC